jgi:hypothetical protein
MHGLRCHLDRAPLAGARDLGDELAPLQCLMIGIFVAGTRADERARARAPQLLDRRVDVDVALLAIEHGDRVTSVLDQRTEVQL